MHEPASDHLDRRTRHRQTLTVSVLLLTILSYYHGVIPVFGPRISEYYSLSAEQYGTMIGLGSLGSMAAMLLAGLSIARIGVRRITELALIGIGGCFVFISLGASLLALKCGIVLYGLFAGLSSVAVPAFLITLFPTIKRRMISIPLVISATAGIVLPLWANELLKWSHGGDDQSFTRLLFGPYLIVGCILLAGTILLSLSKQPTTSNGDQTTSSSLKFRELLGFRSLTIILLVALHGSADNVLYTFLPMFMEDHFDELPLAPAWALAGHGIAYLIARFVISVLPEGFGQRKILMLAGPTGGFVILLMLWQDNAYSIPLVYTLASLCYAAEFPVLVSEISSRSMGNFGTVLGAGFLAIHAATFAFSKGTGRLVDMTGDYRPALSVVACGFIAFGVIAAVTGLGKEPAVSRTR